jgi:hypothetical protein
MNPLTLINAAANVIVAGAVADLALRVFGRPDHPIHAHPVACNTRKFVSSVVICGAVLNIATLSTPSWTEVLLNIGFSLNYLWSSYYAYYDRRTTSSKHSNPPAKIPQQRSASGASDPAKTHKGASAIGIRGKRSAARQNRSV